MGSASAEGGESEAVEALLRFDSKAAALVLEEEVREAFFGSISSAIGPNLFTAALHQHPAHALWKRVMSWQRGFEACHSKAVARELLPGRGRLPEQPLSTSADGVTRMLATTLSPQGGKQQYHECGPVNAGAGVIGIVATWILPSTLEDILAIVLAGLAGYVALLNLPLRRADAKAKLEKVANNFIQVRHVPTSTYSCVLSILNIEGQPLGALHWLAEPSIKAGSSHVCPRTGLLHAIMAEAVQERKQFVCARAAQHW